MAEERSLPGLAQEKAREGGASAPVALWDSPDQARYLAGDVGLGGGYCEILLARSLADAFRNRHTVYPAAVGGDEGSRAC